MTATSEVRLVRPRERQRDTHPTSGMTREQAIASERIWAGYVQASPGMASAWHHHGDFETSIYILKGKVRFEFGAGGSAAVDAREGDFVHVPAGAVHRESNPESAEAVLIVMRAGTGVPTVNVDGPA